MTSTAGDATLSVVDPDTVDTGRQVNGAYAMTQPLMANANNGAFGTVSNTPLGVLTYNGPVTFTLSTTTP